MFVNIAIIAGILGAITSALTVILYFAKRSGRIALILAPFALTVIIGVAVNVISNFLLPTWKDTTGELIILLVISIVGTVSIIAGFPDLKNKFEYHIKIFAIRNHKSRDFSRKNLRDLNLANFDLSRAILVEADLSGSNLRNAKLQYANLMGAKLLGVNLSGADLSFSNLTNTHLSKALFVNTNLIGSDLSGADLYNAIFDRVNLTQAKITEKQLASTISTRDSGIEIQDRMAESINTERLLRIRRNMLQLVWNIWIEGVLMKSLYNEMLIELGIETKPDAVYHPWDMVMQMPDREPKFVAPGTTMLELFDQSSGSLLILGEPGSGKTTMMLELAREAILRAQEEPSQPIPIIFNLSSWTPKLAIIDWLVSELQTKYYVLQKISYSWVENDEMLLLLDGLDEVKVENRAACFRAINDFRKEQSMSLVICSRIQEFRAIDEHLKLNMAVEIRPLTDQQVNTYLETIGSTLHNVQEILALYPEIRELGRTPLMLNILVLAFQHSSLKDLQKKETINNYRKLLLDIYVEKMMKHRGIDKKYTLEQTIMWLGWIARYLVKNGQSIFYIKDLQPNFLSQWLSFRAGNTPRNFVDFLDYCCENIFLRRVDSGYIFVHKMLMEHFAEMYQNKTYFI